jgi:GT2 family glycosyltransferase
MMISVVIPCGSGVSMLLEQLGALEGAQCPEPWEVIVVDNGFSTSEEVGDRLDRFVSSLPGFKVVPAPDKKGAGYARNVGVDAAKGDKLAFLDADDVADAGWLSAMSRALDDHAVVASRWDIEMLNDPDVRATRKNGQATGVRRYLHPNYLDHAGGCGLGVRRSAFDQVGGFDEQFLLLEDTDLTWRLQLAGHELAFAHDAVVHIRFRPTSRDSFRQAYGYGKYNVLLYKTYRERGMPKLTFQTGLRSIGALIANSIQLANPRSRQKFLRSLGFQLGRIGGSIAYVVWGI